MGLHLLIRAKFWFVTSMKLLLNLDYNIRMLSLFCEKYVHEHLLKSEGPWQLLSMSRTLENIVCIRDHILKFKMYIMCGSLSQINHSN